MSIIKKFFNKLFGKKVVEVKETLDSKKYDFSIIVTARSCELNLVEYLREHHIEYKVTHKDVGRVIYVTIPRTELKLELLNLLNSSENFWFCFDDHICENNTPNFSQMAKVSNQLRKIRKQKHLDSYSN